MNRSYATKLLDLADYLKENFPEYLWETDNENQIVIYLGEKYDVQETRRASCGTSTTC